MSYLSKNEAENLQNGKVHLAQIPEFEMEYLENHLEALRLVIARCVAFFTLSFKLNFFRPDFPSIALVMQKLTYTDVGSAFVGRKKKLH